MMHFESRQRTCFEKLVGAHVPLLKFTYRALDIDLVFASLPKEHLDGVNIHDDDLLEEMNEESQLEMKDNKDILSLNGARVTHFLTNRVKNNDAFEVALQTIKTWARGNLFDDMFIECWHLPTPKEIALDQN